MDEDVFVQNPSLTMILTVERPYLSDAWCSSLCIQTEELFDSRFPDLLACLLLIKKLVSDDYKERTETCPMCKQENNAYISGTGNRFFGCILLHRGNERSTICLCGEGIFFDFHGSFNDWSLEERRDSELPSAGSAHWYRSFSRAGISENHGAAVTISIRNNMTHVGLR